MPASRKSIRILQLRRLLDLASIRELPNVRPRALEITGPHMDYAAAVELNGSSADSFAVLARDRLLVQVPRTVSGPVAEVAVFSDYVEPGSRSLAYYDFTDHLFITEGKYRVLQNYLKLLLTTPGTDVWSQDSGGGMLGLLITNVDPQNQSAISGEVESRNLNVVKQITQRQAADPSIPMSERLLSATITNITFSAAETGLHVSLSLTFQDGKPLRTQFTW